MYKLWSDGEAEPATWTTLSENLLEHETCSEEIPVLDGSTYLYKFKAVGDNDEETAEVSGTFTSMSPVSTETHYYDDGTNAFWVANEFERYLPFTVTGYPGTETLTNFPVLVEVRKKDTNGFNYDDFYHTGGRDIAFVDDKGHVIPHEIDTWNPNGMSLIWVRLPEMNNGTKFTMCYRSPLVNPPIGDYAAGTPEYNFIVEIGNVAWDESSGTASWVETIAKSDPVSYTWLYEANHIGATFDLNPPPGMAWTPTAFTEIPEPSSGLLLLIGGALLALRRRNR